MSDVEVLVAGTRRTHARDTEPSTYDAAVFISFNRAWGLFQSMKTLLAYSFGEEAAALGRPLMEESLRLMELASTDDLGRAALALAWLKDTLMRRLELIQEARLSGKATQEDEEKGKANVETRLSEIAAYQDRLGIQKLRKFPHWKNLADAHGRRDEYWDYLLMQQMVHGGELSQCASGDEGSRLELGISRPHNRYLNDRGGFLDSRPVHALRAYNDVQDSWLA